MKVAIIGRGIAGLSLAYELVGQGLKVVIIGPRNKPGSASHVAQGVSSLKAQAHARTPLFYYKKLGHQDLRAWIKELSKKTNVNIPYLDGAHEAFSDFSDFQKIHQRIFKFRYAGFCPVKIIDESEGLNVFNRKYVQGSYYYFDDFWLHPPTLLDVLERYLLSNGVEFIDEELQQFYPDLSRGWFLQTNKSFIRSDELVIAAGSFTKSILSKADINLANISIHYGHTSTMEVSSEDKFLLLRGKYSLAAYGNKVYLGSSSADSLEKLMNLMMDDDLLMRPFLNILDHRFFVQSEGRTTIKHHYGMRLKTKKLLPLVGPLKVLGNRRLFLFTAFYKNGFQLAHFFAKKLARELLENIDSCGLELRL